MLLEARDAGRERNLLARLARRWIVFAAAATPVGGAVLVVAARLAEPDGWAYPLYVLHDAVYLPLKGHLWTRWFPDAVAAFAVFGALTVLGLAGFLSGRPVLHALHVAASRAALERTALHPLLRRWLVRAGGSRRMPSQLDLLAEAAREAALDTLWRPEGRAPRAESAVALTLLVAARRRLGPGHAAADCLECALILDPAATGAPAHLAALADCVHTLVADADTMPLLADAVAVMDALAGGAGQDGLRATASAVLDRIALIESTCANMHKRLRGSHPDPAPPQPPPEAGRLALLVAAGVAKAAGRRDILLTWLSALAALDVAAGAAPSDDPWRAFAAGLTAKAPANRHFAIAAALSGAPDAHAARALAQASPAILTTADLDLMGLPSRRLRTEAALDGT